MAVKACIGLPEPCSSSRVLKAMRTLLFLLFLAPAIVQAQPALPDIRFTVIDERGRPLLLDPQPRFAFILTADHPYMDDPAGKHEGWSLSGEVIRDGWRKRTVYNVLECWCTDRRVTLQHEGAVMRLIFPDDHTDKHRLVERGAGSGAPEVIPFRPGTVYFMDLLDGPGALKVKRRMVRRAGLRK